MTTDTRTKRRRVSRGRLHGRRDGEGRRDDPPDLATMLAVVTTDYRSSPGEAIDFLRPAVDDDLQRDLGRRRVLDERHGRPARERRERHRAHARDATGRSRSALREVCPELAAQIVADGEGATVLAEIAVTGAASDAEARAIARRIATSPLVKTALFGHDANWGRVLAGGRLGALQRRLRHSRSRPAHAQLQRHRGRCERARRWRRARRRGRPARSSSTSGSARAASYLTSDLSYDYVRINAEYTT